MSALLLLKTSIFSDQGQSSQLVDHFVASWRAEHPSDAVVVRDLAAAPVPHLDAMRFGAFLAKEEERTPEQREVVRYSDELIAELRRADTLVIGLPMYNFGIPSGLKAYFDHVARAGVTFRYSETGPVGLLTGKRAIVFATRGGIYAGTPRDSQTGYVRQFLGFLGITDVQFIYAEALAYDPKQKTESLEQARGHIARVIAATSPDQTAAIV